MKRLIKRLSRRGASVLIAILVFLLAALSGTIALTMASSNAGRFTHEKEDQQAYLSVASAAKLICKKLETTQVKLTSKDLYEEGREVPKDPSDIDTVEFLQEDTDNVVSTNLLFFSDSRFINNIKLLAPYQNNEGGDSEGDKTFDYKKISFELTAENTGEETSNISEMGTVQVELNMNDMSFVFQLWLKRGDHRLYQMMMDVPFEWKPANWTATRSDGSIICTIRGKWTLDKAKFSFENASSAT